MARRIRALALTGVMAILPTLTSCANGPGVALSTKVSAQAQEEDAQCASGNRAYFGDTHLHTALSPDAGLAGTKLGLEEAYRFARGETVTSNSGQKAALKRPLDFPQSFSIGPTPWAPKSIVPASRALLMLAPPLILNSLIFGAFMPMPLACF